LFTLLVFIRALHPPVLDPLKLVWALAALLLYAQTAANWACGPSAFLRSTNEAFVCGAILLMLAPGWPRRWAFGLLAAGWLATVPYCLIMP
jgi:hypothetical protein